MIYCRESSPPLVFSEHVLTGLNNTVRRSTKYTHNTTYDHNNIIHDDVGEMTIKYNAYAIGEQNARKPGIEFEANGRGLTDIDVGQERGGQTEDEHQYVGHGQVDDEIVGNVAHPGRPADHRHHQQIADQPDQEHHGVRETVDGRHGGAVPVPELAGADATGTAGPGTATHPGAVVFVVVDGRTGTVGAATGTVAGTVRRHGGRYGR